MFVSNESLNRFSYKAAIGDIVFNTLRTGSFKLFKLFKFLKLFKVFKRPFPEFLTILTL